MIFKLNLEEYKTIGNEGRSISLNHKMLVDKINEIIAEFDKVVYEDEYDCTEIGGPND